jgi:hypothetical protein
MLPDADVWQGLPIGHWPRLAHADQDQADVAAVVQVAELLKRGCLEAVGLVDKDRSGWVGCRGWSEYVLARSASPETARQRPAKSRSTMRGVLITPGVCKIVRHGPLSGRGM